jgi:hypothetical protein
MDASRRSLLIGGTAAAALAPGTTPAATACAQRGGIPQALPLSGAPLLTAFMKLRASTDPRLTIGWMDAVNYAFIEGEAIPLYRLYAATWARFERRSDDLFEGRSIELAYFTDMRSGELLETLTLPRTGRTVTVPRYRAGPSTLKVMASRKETREFDMPGETRDAGSFFVRGQAISEQYLSQPERRGERIAIREDNGARVVTPAGKAGGFFYREWVIWSGDLDAVMRPDTACVEPEVDYSATTAWRPWMQMGDTPGHTLQNGRGGKAQRPEDLPPEHLRLTRKFHPDLLDDPERVLGK